MFFINKVNVIIIAISIDKWVNWEGEKKAEKVSHIDEIFFSVILSN